MNLPETACFLQQIDILKPAYFEWRQRTADKQAAAHDKTPPQIMGQMVGALADTLAEITPAEAGDAIDAISEGKLSFVDRGANGQDFPAWAELGDRVRRWVMEQRSQKKSTRLAIARDPREAPRYRCLNCRDTGVVLVFNVFFVREFRSLFEAYNGACPKNFREICQHFATMHHGKHVTLPLSHVGICNCDGDQSHMCRAQLSDWMAGRMKSGRYPRGGTFEWRPDKCPIYPDGTDPGMFKALADWYASNPELF